MSYRTAESVLYSIFIYTSATGLLVWERNFDPSSMQQLELFGSFFSAIKSFLQEMVLRGTNNNTLKNIEMGSYIINIISIQDLGLDLVYISDAVDGGKLKKITPKIVEIIESHAELFAGWEGGNLNRFDPISAPIEDIIGKQKDLITARKSLTTDQEVIIKELFAKRGKLALTEAAALQRERERLKGELTTSSNLDRKSVV